ncbi:MAG: prepilin-type N-terminal cleavage/methylation domain-containing protein [Minisyncoccia bacterium]|jgi:prepilin-type N-terminal cleavage/methylation domain-containing protein
MKGFTLIELLVIVAISAMLSAIAITYTSIARNQVALSVETSKVAQFILRAKSLAIATYNSAPGTCGYGASFDIANNAYSLFAYNPDPSKYNGAVSPCPSVASTTALGISSGEMGQYSQSSWDVSLANGVRMESGGNGNDLALVLFSPPDPAVLISRDGQNFLDPALTQNMTSKVHLVTADGSASTTISVNAAGQVNF